MDSIATPAAPAAVGPYSQAIKVGDMLFCSGQIPLDASTMSMVGDDAGEQTAQVLKNLHAVLSAAGLDLSAVVKTTVFLSDLGDFSAMNAVYEKAFGDHRPARACVEVSRIPKDALVEIECIAWAG